MKVMICGDWHGNTQAAKTKIYLAKEHDCDQIWQVGDFGLWPGPAGAAYLKKLNLHASATGIKIYWLDGNHEWHDKIDRMMIKADLNNSGWPIRTDWDSILYMPRGYRWESRGNKFMALGGAVSIDKDYRLEVEDSGGNKCWWPQEQLTDEQTEFAKSGGECDVMLTHDCPADVIHDWMMIPSGNYKMLNESHMHRVKLQSVVDAVKPKWIIHGHLHYPYHKMVNMAHGPVHVVGLNMESDRDSHIYFDTEKLEVLPS